MDARDAVKDLTDSLRKAFQARYGYDSWAYVTGYLESLLISTIDDLPKAKREMLLERIRRLTEAELAS